MLAAIYAAIIFLSTITAVFSVLTIRAHMEARRHHRRAEAAWRRVERLRGEPQNGPQSAATPETRESPSGDPERPGEAHREAENDAIRANDVRGIQEDT